jgi:DedD protein
MAEPADINVDELRRRARRRLVGAIVLALGVAVVVPMLLETEQKPLGEDVSVKIPPVDTGKFVNRLNGSPAQDAAKGAPSAPAADVTAKSAAPAASPTPGSATERPSKYDTHIPDTAAPASVASPKAPPEAPAVAETAKPVEPSANVAVSVAKATPHEDFAVQLAAFADDKGANALARRLKTAGYTAYTEPLKTSKGTLWRVRVGPYPSREAAAAARDRLKSEGQSGIVAAVK